MMNFRFLLLIPIKKLIFASNYVTFEMFLKYFKNRYCSKQLKIKYSY